MSRHASWLTKILPFPSADTKDGGHLDKESYKRFARGLSVVLTILVLVPLIIITTLSHNLYQQLLEEEELDQLVLNLEEAQRTIEAFVGELKSVVKYLGSSDRTKEILDSQELVSILARLQQEYPDFVDIQLIDSDGMQMAYAGPYQLRKHNYSSQPWYMEVLERGESISNVFTGFRNIPHFVIAVRMKSSLEHENCVLRVTINASTLQAFIDTINSGYADDLFLVDSKYIAQTKPQKYGVLGKGCVLHEKQKLTDSHPAAHFSKKDTKLVESAGLVVYKRTYKGQQINQAVADLLDTPWSLVLVKEQYLHASSWIQFKIKLISIFVTCTLVALFVIVEISHALTAHIRESDKKRQQLYSEAEHSNKLASIGRLAAGVAHEINNPLAIINQKAGLVHDFMEFSDYFANKEDMAKAVDGIQSSVKRCKAITHRLLGFARQTDVFIEEIDVNNTIREVVEFLAKEATYNQIKIDFNLCQDVKGIMSSRGPLQQIFLNIINNAIDAIGHGGTIMLSSKQINEQIIQLTIVDDGPGMHPEVLEHIFEPFFTTKETGKGTGLGLSITYGLIQKLGGSIKVKSKIGKGTVFRITLPVTHDE